MVESHHLIDIRNQVEYYLSDTNLKTDEFFRKEIQNNEEGYLKLEFLLKCNKIRKLSATQELIIEALKNSDKLELHPDNTGVRRKNNHPLPEPAPSKKLKTEKNSESFANIPEHNHHQHDEHKNDHEASHKEEEKKADKFANYEPLILNLNVEGSDKVDWRDVRRKIEQQFGIEIFYMTRTVSPGNIVLNKNAVDTPLLESICSAAGLPAENNIVYKLTHASEEDISSFWTSNGPHYNTRIETLRTGEKAGDFKKKKDRKGKNDVVIFGKQKYYDISKLKDIFKNLLNKSANGEQIKEPGHTMLLELIHHHDKFKEKSKDVAHFTVDVHPDHQDTRCFFVVRHDGSREDFSAMKCIKNLQK